MFGLISDFPAGHFLIGRFGRNSYMFGIVFAMKRRKSNSLASLSCALGCCERAAHLPRIFLSFVSRLSPKLLDCEERGVKELLRRAGKS